METIHGLIRRMPGSLGARTFYLEDSDTSGAGAREEVSWLENKERKCQVYKDQ